MNKSQSFFSAIQFLTEKNNPIIFLSTNPSIDAICAATSLYFALQKIGKNVGIVSSGSINNSGIIGAENISKSLSSSGNNLIISLPYTDGSIEKVTSNIEGNEFKLTITPGNGFPKIEPKNLKFVFEGGDFDSVIAIDVVSQNMLGNLFFQNISKFENKDILNIDKHQANANFGTINLISPETSSISELIFLLIQKMNIEIDKDIATNLFNGIMHGSNNLTLNSVSADTYQACSLLLRSGAVKKSTKPQTSNNMYAGFEKQGGQKIANVENKDVKEDVDEKDWLKPNIFKGGTLA